ncbi:MAG TPA: SagB family peptide dehydrogenase [Actinomycetota bacterium]
MGRRADGAVEIRHPWGAQLLTGVTDAIADVLADLGRRWVPKADLWTRTAGAGNNEDAGLEVTAFSRLLWTLTQLESVCALRLVDGVGEPYVTVEPAAAAASLDAAFATCEQPRLSRLAYITRHDDGMAVESAVALHRVVLHTDWSMALLGRLARGLRSGVWETATEESPGGANAVIRLLGAAGMLQGSERGEPAGLSHDVLALAELHDLLFHRRSRLGLHDDAFGGTFPFLDRIPAPPAVRERPTGDAILLGVPPEPAPDAEPPFAEVLEKRASVRRYGSEPLTIRQLGELLFRTARARARYGPEPEAGLPYEALDRPVPSGGGMHDLEVYLVADRVDGLASGLYHYDAARHALEPLPPREGAATSLLQGAIAASGAPEPPHVLITIASRFTRMAWKYRAISYATTLKNVGALYQTVYLVATAMRIGTCALGSGNSAVQSKAFDLTARSEIPVGEMMLGSLPADGPDPGERAHLKAHTTWTALVEPDWGRRRHDEPGRAGDG